MELVRDLPGIKPSSLRYEFFTEDHRLNPNLVVVELASAKGFNLFISRDRRGDLPNGCLTVRGLDDETTSFIQTAFTTPEFVALRSAFDGKVSQDVDNLWYLWGHETSTRIKAFAHDRNSTQLLSQANGQMSADFKEAQRQRAELVGRLDPMPRSLLERLLMDHSIAPAARAVYSLGHWDR